MAIIHKKKVTEKYGQLYEESSIYDKFKTYRDKTGNVRYRARENKSNKLSREIYNVKGQIIFRMKVSSYRFKKRTLIRDFVSEEEIVIDRGLLQTNLREVVENAKLQAIYAHFRKKGDIDLINDTKRLKKQIVKIELQDYIVNYNKGYSRKNKLSYLKFEKDKKTKDTEAYIYDEKSKKYNLYTVTQHKTIKMRENELNNIKIQQERTYDKVY